MPDIVVPYTPRPLQRVIHRELARHRWAVAVCHRRFGKSVMAVNHLQKAATSCQKQRPRFAYVAPTYRQGKAIVWDYMKHYAGPIPGHRAHESELRIDYPNAGQVRIFGADNPDSLRGLYFDGVVFDEYGLQPPNIFSEVVRPLLADREGWALFIGTPNGKNQFYDVAQQAQREADWFYATYKASETGIVNSAELADARRSMTSDEYDQEFECSFEASVQGAVYAREMQRVREDGRIAHVPYEPLLKVDTDWDIGIGDPTAIWFTQDVRGQEIRVIDYYEHAGVGLNHYKAVLDQKGYAYGTHYAPHDMQVKEWGANLTRLESAALMGLHFQVCPKVEKVEDRIHATRMMLSKCYFDAAKCERGIEALKNYRWGFNNSLNEFTKNPLHNWASHGADAFGGIAMRQYLRVRNPERDAAMAVRAAQRDTDPFHWGGTNVGRRGGY